MRCRRRRRGLRERRRAARPRACSSGCCGRRPAPHRGRARGVRDGRLPRRPAVDARSRGLGSRRPRARRTRVAAARRPQERLLAYASSVRARRAGGARAPLCRAARRGRPRGQDPVPPTPTGARTSRSSRPCATRSVREFEIMVDANQGWRMPGDRAPRWDVATAPLVRARARAARRLLARGAAAHRRLRRLPRAARAHATSGSPRARWCAREHEARDLVRARRRRRDPARRRARGRVGGCRRIAALADLHGRTWSPHTWSNGYGLLANLHAALAFSTCPYVEVPFDPPALVGRAPRLAAARAARDRRRRHDRAAGRPGPRRRARSRRARALPRRHEDRAPQSCREPGTPGRGRGRRARPAAATTRCSCASRRPGCATPTCTSPTASSATAAGRWCSGTRAPGVVEAVGSERHPRSGRATASRSASCPPCRLLPRLPPRAGRTSARPRPSTRSRGTLHGRHVAPRSPGRHAAAALPASTVLLRRALPSSRGAGACRSATSCRSGRRRSSAAASSPVSARCETPRGSRRANRSA